MTVLTATAEQPPEDPFDPARIDETIDELRAVWQRNPRKTMMQIVTEAQKYTPLFVPSDISDARFLYGLRQIGKSKPPTG